MKWRVHKRDYEGLPLFLRHPVGLDASALMPRLPVLLTITLEFAEVFHRVPQRIPGVGDATRKHLEVHPPLCRRI